jgi:Flp pilus assembly pilin Flp
MTKHLVRLQTATFLRVNGDRGQGALEYVGLIIIIAVIAAAVITAFSTQEGAIRTAVDGAIQKFLTGS